MEFLESIGRWKSFMMEPLEARVMLSAALPALDQDIPFVRDAGGGRVVIAADAWDWKSGVVPRLGSDGQLDTTFGDHGTVTAAMPRQSGAITSLNILPDGEIWVSAWASAFGGLFARFHSDGSPDESFGNGGVADYSLNGWDWNTFSDG